MEKVRKRKGKIEKFRKHKLWKSIHLSMRRTGVDNKQLEEKVTDDVVKHLKRKKTATSEDIRNAVCVVLKKNKHHEVCDFYSLVWLHAKPVKIKGVIKRSGRKEKFSPEKLFKSVQKSFSNAHVHDGRKLENVTCDILVRLNSRYKGKDVSVEDIRDFIELSLMKHKLDNVAKHYILHRYM